MARMPREQEAFAEQVSTMLNRMRPELEVELTGPKELIVNGRRLDLENLVRLVSTDADRGVEIVEQYLDNLFDDEAFSVTGMSWDEARTKVMPRIQPESIFDHLSRDLVAHVPFVNGTVVVFVIDMPNMTVSVTTEQMLRWGVRGDLLDEIARENLERYTDELSCKTLEADDGGCAIVIGEQDGYDASRLLLPGLYETFAATLGGNFHVAIPSRDMFLAVSAGPEGFLDRVVRRVQQDFVRLPYPITDRMFYCCLDGIAGDGRPDVLGDIRKAA